MVRPYRAVDSVGKTLDFVLSPTRDACSAEYFFRKLFDDAHTVAPRVINVDKNASYPPAFKAGQEAGQVAPECQRRPVKYLNNIIEQDHRFIQRRVRPGWGLARYRTAWATLRGCEAMNQLRKGQIEGSSKGAIVSQVRFMTVHSVWLPDRSAVGRRTPNFLVIGTSSSLATDPARAGSGAPPGGR